MRQTKLAPNFTAVLLLVSSILLAFPWPFGTPGPDPVNNYTIIKNYGAMNCEWSTAGPSTTNFHSGLDFSEQDISLEEVYTVENGFVTDIWNDGFEYKVIVCTTSSDDEGFVYKHLNGNTGNPINLKYVTVGYEYDDGDMIAKMRDTSLQHLHFQVAYDTFIDGQHGLENPLIYLNPSASSGENFTWTLYSDGLQNNLEIFFLRDYPAFDGPGDQDWEHLWSTGEDVRNSVLNSLSLNGSVDLFFNIGCWANGEVGFPVPLADGTGCIPQKIEWSLSRNTVNGTEILTTREVVDFSGELGKYEHWDEYKRFYFKFLGCEVAPNGAGSTYITCLTNCADNATYNGISNIEENCWDTHINIAGTGDATSLEDAEYPDGEYEIEVRAYAFGPFRFLRT